MQNLRTNTDNNSQFIHPIWIMILDRIKICYALTFSPFLSSFNVCDHFNKVGKALLCQSIKAEFELDEAIKKGKTFF
jgi:hypothetical protein